MNRTARQLRKLEARRLRKRNKKAACPAAQVARALVPAASGLIPTPVPAPDPASNPSHDREGVASPSPVSPAKLAANRSNAQLSSGPRSEAGKAISSRNNTRHGLAGEFSLLPNEDAEQFQILIESLSAEHQPKTTTETLLVWNMAKHHWLVQRALKLQDECFLNGVDDKNLSLYMRYQTTHQRAFHRCLNDLVKLQKQRAAEQRGFESQKLKMEAQKLKEARAAAKEQREIELHKARLLTERARQNEIQVRAIVFQTKHKAVSQPAAAA